MKVVHLIGVAHYSNSSGLSTGSLILACAYMGLQNQYAKRVIDATCGFKARISRPVQNSVTLKKDARVCCVVKNIEKKRSVALSVGKSAGANCEPVCTATNTRVTTE